MLGGIAVLTLRRPSLAAGVDPNRWALLSDTHIAADPQEVKLGVNMTDHLRATVAELQARPTRPVGLIVNGDCPLDVGLPGDYHNFLELLQPVAQMEVPMHFTLGNHDNREAFWNTFAAHAALARPVAGKHLSIIETPRANWFLLDSLEETKSTPGFLGAEQLAWLTKALDERARKPALLMLHHHPINADPAKKLVGLKDAEDFLSIVMPRRQVKAVFYGHTHQWRQIEREGLHFINLPAVAYPTGTTQPTGWVDCQLAANQMTLELRAHDAAHPGHGKPVDFLWRT
jgi:3',5'-cyclic AMP phosphodiesterase CpdA